MSEVFGNVFSCYVSCGERVVPVNAVNLDQCLKKTFIEDLFRRGRNSRSLSLLICHCLHVTNATSSKYETVILAIPVVECRKDKLPSTKRCLLSFSCLMKSL